MDWMREILALMIARTVRGGLQVADLNGAVLELNDPSKVFYEVTEGYRYLYWLENSRV